MSCQGVPPPPAGLPEPVRKRAATPAAPPLREPPTRHHDAAARGVGNAAQARGARGIAVLQRVRLVHDQVAPPPLLQKAAVQTLLGAAGSGGWGGVGGRAQWRVGGRWARGGGGQEEQGSPCGLASAGSGQKGLASSTPAQAACRMAWHLGAHFACLPAAALRTCRAQTACSRSA